MALNCPRPRQYSPMCRNPAPRVFVSVADPARCTLHDSQPSAGVWRMSRSQRRNRSDPLIPLIRGPSELCNRCSCAHFRALRGCRLLSIASPCSFLPSKQVILDDDIDSSHAVPPPNFFPLFVRPAIIRNADLENSIAGFCHLRGNLRFKPKPVLFNGKVMQEFAPKHFVTCLHVGEVQVCKHVGEQREKSVSHHMPEVNQAMRAAAQEPGTEHNVGTILQNRGKKDGIFSRVVL